MNATKTSQLFSPVELGLTRLKHRVVMAPLTRSRSVQPDGVPGDLMLEYYTQRASDGGLIISEAAQLSLATRGWHGAPGMYSDAQVDGWKKIVDAVHTKGGHIFAQLWHPGRFSHVSLTGGEAPVSASVDPEYWHNPSRLISTPSGWIQPSPIALLRNRRFPAWWKTMARQSNVRNQPASMGSRFMRGTAISLTSFFRTAAINERMNMVVRSKTEPVFRLRLSKQWFPRGPMTAWGSASLQVARSTRCPTPTQKHCMPMSLKD